MEATTERLIGASDKEFAEPLELTRGADSVELKPALEFFSQNLDD
jgi:hypothetical protein